MDVFTTPCPEGREGCLVQHWAFRCHQCESQRHTDTKPLATGGEVSHEGRWVRSRVTRSRIYLDRAGDCPDCGGPILPWTIVTSTYFCDHCKTWWERAKGE
jgi:hypothetical protein